MTVLLKAQQLWALPRGRRDFALQLAIWFGFAFGYQVARGLADRGPTEALANARRIVRLERYLGAFFEPDVQRPVLQTGQLLIHAVDWTYWLSQFAVVGLALLYIYLRHNDAYLPVRNALIVTNTIGLVGYVLLPTAPPRLIPGAGIVDTLAQTEVINHNSNLVQLASNPYAAMPSLHAADAVIIGVALARLVQPRLLKVAFALWPAWVSFSLIATGNHFWLDIIAGLLLAAVGGWVASRLPGRRGTRTRDLRRDRPLRVQRRPTRLASAVLREHAPSAVPAARDGVDVARDGIGLRPGQRGPDRHHAGEAGEIVNGEIRVGEVAPGRAALVAGERVAASAGTREDLVASARRRGLRRVLAVAPRGRSACRGNDQRHGS